jgi:cell division protein FtsI/penicillin-binding protein 2
VEQRMAAEAPEGGWRYTMFGKSGTAQIPLGKAPPGKRRPPGNRGYFDEQYNSSFIAGAPLEEPRLVVLVVIDDPGPDRRRNRTHYGSQVAGPVVRRVVERSLSYMGVPPSPARKGEGGAGE